MKLPQVSGKELIKILHKFGFVAVRQRGSHIRLEKRTKEDFIKLTVPMHKILKKGTLSRIIRDAGLKIEDVFKK